MSIVSKLTEYSRVNEAIRAISKPDGRVLSRLEEVLGKAQDATAVLDGSMSGQRHRKASDVLYAARALRLAIETWTDPEDANHRPSKPPPAAADR